MKLKKVKMVGFKSFADKVELEFHNGITGIVGPNGCGKSNIADAFRWVMGEQSAKSMRGGKMLDIIFAGTSSRKPVGLAEVSLTFSNDKGLVGIPYSEVEITRRYHRDGESEYLINGNEVRLKDIQSILIDVGIGKNAYAIFEQGKIDQIIQLGPEERRTIFEEAAGILKFLMNKRETEKKLAEIDLNASRLKDIQDEVQKEIDHLAGQASRAKEYSTLRNRLEALQEESLTLKITHSSLKQQEQQTQLSKTSSELKLSQEKQQEQHEQVTLQKEELEKESALLKERERALYQIKSLLDVRKKELETLKERLVENQNRSQALHKERERLVVEREARKKEIQSRLEAKTSLSGSLESYKTSLERAKEEFSDAEKKLGACRRELEKIQERVLSLTRTSSARLSEWKQKSVRFDTLKEKVALAEKVLKEQAAKQEKLTLEEGEKRTTLEKASLEVDEARALFNELDKEIKELTHESEEVLLHFEKVGKERLEMKAREKALLKLQEEFEGASKGTKALLQEASKESSPLHQKVRGLWEYFDIQSGFEEAVAAVLKPYSDTLVVESLEAFKEVLGWAEAQKVTEFSLVHIDPAAQIPSESGSLVKKVKINAAAAHFLGGKKVVENLAEALQQIQKRGGHELFSMDGYFIDHSGTLFRSLQKGGSLFLREAEIKALAEKLKGVEEEYLLYKARLDKLREVKTEKTEQRSLLDKKLRSLEMQLVEKNFALQRILQELQGLAQQAKEKGEEKARALQEIEGTEKELIGLKALGEEEEAKLKGEEKSKAELALSLEELLKHHRKMKEALLKEESAFEKSADESRKVSHSLNLLEVKDQESLNQEQRILEHLKELEGGAAQLTAKRSELEETMTVEQKSCDKQAAETEKCEKALLAKKEALKSQELKLSQAEGALNKEREKLQKGELELALIGQELEALYLDFKEKLPNKEFKAKQGNLTKERLKEELSAAEKEMRRLKESLEGYTDVNLAAAASLDQHQERASFLEKERGDLIGSSEELRLIVQKLSDESRELFKTTLEAIRVNFKKNFQILFNGGEADLELTSADDILKAGIEIVAKPPGKQMRSINLLSGGEKCLTAMALLFSIFEVKAAPFCILDEIDAPLDDSNVERFCTMVKHFADKCQFIVITHNKRTMAMADRLYGVSMEERGVSKMLKMEFQQTEAKKAVLV